MLPTAVRSAGASRGHTVAAGAFNSASRHCPARMSDPRSRLSPYARGVRGQDAEVEPIKVVVSTTAAGRRPTVAQDSSSARPPDPLAPTPRKPLPAPVVSAVGLADILAANGAPPDEARQSSTVDGHLYVEGPAI